jgi:hypothetical protein
MGPGTAEKGPQWPKKRRWVSVTAKKEKALAALLVEPTRATAAKAAGISERTLRRYLHAGDFQQAYRQALNDLVEDAAAKAKYNLAPSMDVLSEIATDPEQPATTRVAAARSLLEFGIRLTEHFDTQKRIDELAEEIDRLEGNP